VRRWSVGLFIGAQYLAGLRIDQMDLQAKQVTPSYVSSPFTDPLPTNQACTQRPALRLGDLVFDIAQLCTPNLAYVAAFVGWSKSLIKKDAPAARGVPGQSSVGW